MPTQDPQKMLKDLALELGKVHKELDKTKDGGKKRGTKELEAAALTNILEALAKGVDLVTCWRRAARTTAQESRIWR